jgi:hypothetical protein
MLTLSMGSTSFSALMGLLLYVTNQASDYFYCESIKFTTNSGEPHLSAADATFSLIPRKMIVLIF